MNEKYSKYYSSASDEAEAIIRLKDIIEILRRECPWDRVQTHRTLIPCMIEEAYESVDAIERNDSDNLREELGDVLMQVIFHSSLSGEEGQFDLTDVINDECEKMIRRHPHIFSDGEAKTVDKVLKKWENIKSKEHSGSSVTSRLKSVPNSFPALIRSAKVQKKAGSVGFDFSSTEEACVKLTEETQEVIDACREDNKRNITEEIGDLLFSVVNVARFLDVEPESALRAAVDKFIGRFEYVEHKAESIGRSVSELSIAEMDAFWEEAKGK